MNPQEKENILNALLKDYDNTKAEIRIALHVQEKTCTWLTVGIIIAFSYCIAKEYKIAFLFFPAIVLGQFSLVLNRHVMMIAVLSSWLGRIEACINLLLDWDNLFNWERNFVRNLYESFSINIKGLKYFKPQTIFNFILLLPSLAIFFFSIHLGSDEFFKKFGNIIENKAISDVLFWIFYLFLLYAVLQGYFMLLKKRQVLEDKKNESIEEFKNIFEKKIKNL